MRSVFRRSQWEQRRRLPTIPGVSGQQRKQATGYQQSSNRPWQRTPAIVTRVRPGITTRRYVACILQHGEPKRWQNPFL